MHKALPFSGMLQLFAGVPMIKRASCPCSQASDTDIYVCRCYSNPMIKSKGWSEKSAAVEICDKCGHSFDSSKESEVAMGAVACPKCHAPVHQKSAAEKEKPARKLTWQELDAEKRSSPEHLHHYRETCECCGSVSTCRCRAEKENVSVDKCWKCQQEPYPLPPRLRCTPWATPARQPTKAIS